MANRDWLDLDFLEKCMGEEVADFSTSAAVPPGNNYSSVIRRVTLKIGNKPETTSIIVKSELAEGTLRDSFNIPQSCEYDFYYKFLPEARKISSSVNFAPKAFTSPRPCTLILEDLKAAGFMMADRLQQLDFDHCRLYMIAAAKFHAVSFAMIQQDPKVKDLFSEEQENVELLTHMINYGQECFLECTKGKEKFTRVHSVVQNISDRFKTMLLDVSKPTGKLETLIQGDPWVTNMMFKYNDRGEVTDIKLLDFQQLRILSPVHDLILFLWSSANHDVRNSRLPDLLKVYIDHFNNTLGECNCNEVLTDEYMADEMRRLSPYILFVVCSFTPLVLYPKPADFTEILKGGQAENPYKKVYSEQFCKLHLPQVVAQMEKLGVIDCLEESANC